MNAGFHQVSFESSDLVIPIHFSPFVDKNIQINAISPSMVDTKFLENINEKIVEISAYNHPLKRNATVEDITPTIKFLISNESDYMNGINIPITGGSIF